VARRAEKGFAKGWRAEVQEAAISYAVNHPIRLDCLAILIERTASSKEIADILEIEIPSADHHVRELFVDGVVERVKTEKGGHRRGAKERFYRARVRPEVSDEELARMPKESRREMAGCILRAIVALGLSALRHGAMDDDDNLHLAWKIVRVDPEGDEELAEAEAKHLESVEAIRQRNELRAVEQGTKLSPRVVASMGFKRGEPGSLVELGAARKIEQHGD
jgi:predicted transcriptional regulator